MSGGIGRQEFRVRGLSEPISHYTDAVRFGDLLFVSGVAPLDANGRVPTPDDVVGQVELVFQNLKKVLDTAGAAFSDVLKVTVYLTNVADRTKINPVRQRYFGDSRPASTQNRKNEHTKPKKKDENETEVGLPN